MRTRVQLINLYLQHSSTQFCMKQLFVTVFTIVMAAVFLGSTFAAEKQQDLHSTTPVTNADTPWRIAYLQGGPYQDYQSVLIATIEGLMELGWLEKSKIPRPAAPDNTSEIWEWLAKQNSPYLEFVPDGFYDSAWDDEVRARTRQELLDRLNTGQDIDLMLAMGTWAGQDLANNEHSVPTTVMSSSDPLRSHIIKSLRDSGYNHLHARIDPTRYKRQIRMFHGIFGFHKLGVVYEDTEAGRSYAALEDIETLAEERGFQIVRCFAQDTGLEMKECENNVVKCHEELAPKIDALYLTTQRGVNLRNMPRLLAPLHKYNLPTFSQSGESEVKHGALLSIATASKMYMGEFHAEAIAKIFHGAKPRDLNMISEPPTRIAINMATAKLIGVESLMEDYLEIADVIYHEIAVVENALQ